MKWPTQLIIVRHAQSQYNILRDKKAQDEEYQAFKAAYDRDYRSAETRQLAERLHKKFGLGVGDADTLLTASGLQMAKKTGAVLRASFVEVPNVIFHSPYQRTVETLNAIKWGWSELSRVKTVPEDRIREQEHGLSILYSDWRIFHVMHPEQKLMYDLQGKYWYQYPQGESVSEVRDRIRSFLSTLIREYAGQRVMLVTHHLTILSIRATLERLSPEEFIRLDEEEKPVNCGVTIYLGDPAEGRNGRLVLAEYNVKLY